MSRTRHTASRRDHALVAWLFAAALFACAPAPSAAGPSPSPGAATVVSPAPAASAAAAPAPLADVAPGPDMVAYHGETKGHLALPPGLAAGVKAPGLVIVHEWWGLNDYIKGEADRLAKEGYAVLAVDLYGGKYATTQDQARMLTGGLNQDAATANLKGAVAYLRGRQDVAKVAALGWCFGGGQALKLLLAQPDLAAGVIYYGSLESDPAKVKGLPPILGIFGKADTSVTPAHVQAFDQALTTAGVPHEIHSYDGAPHAFANPTGGERYKADAAADAWTKTLAFLAKHLK